MYSTASSVLAVDSTPGTPDCQIGAARMAPTARASTSPGSSSGSGSRDAPNEAVSTTAASRPRRRWTGRPACSSIRVSSHDARAPARTTSALNSHAGAFTTISRNAGSSTAVLSKRFSTAGLPAPPTSPPAATATATSHSTEAARPPLELRDGTIEVDRPEVRPVGGRDPQLGVGDLPQQEVRDPHLTAGADQQIGIRHAVGVEGAADVGLRDVVGSQLAGPHAAGQRAEGVEQLVAAAVVEGHQQGEAAVGARLVDDVVDPAPHRQRHAVVAPDHAQAHVALHQLRQLTVDRLLQQPHQRRDLVLGPAPVLRRERVERQVAQPDGVGRPHDGPGRLHALAMAGHPRQALARRPPAVAVHDDGDVGWRRLRPDQREQILLAESLQGGCRRRAPQNDRISCSFFFSSSSTLAMKRSVVFCTWSWARRSSSSESTAFLSLAAALSLSLASLRTLRMATRASSPSLATGLTSCLLPPPV